MKKVLFFGLIVVFVALTLWFATVELDGALEEWVFRYGYLGFLGAAFLGGLNFAVPSIHLAFIVPLLNVGLEIWALVLLGALGTTLADSVGYALGHSGGAAFTSLARVRRWGEGVVVKYPRLAPIFLFIWISLVPIPNEIFVIPAGLIRYGFLKTILITFAGNIVFNFLALNFGNLFV
ncbi:hypothetical protein A2116_01705 [Candidatus Jorgensenbacteria bacterium GWA1_49_17]|uniref:DedA family protein n=2 Tax=Candidatus Joergenseniibacteriota TaxID=1752739 RepID=A0A1F6BPP7_9BACT|nr:MAG: hypothetical protein A2127_02040 [Candidatus Jorgensenbacteria bacterium GWC1_48_12]OGG40381.1 MAG: hypothetical protein A2116_01705 [Candidatus Jorgensenbacteria bacterium GWA1_49_17]